MRLSQIFELLLILVLISFAASRTIDSKAVRPIREHGKVKYKNRQDNVNRYCNCSTKLCKCCGDFSVPVINVKGPGCASLQYLKGDRLGLLLSFGDRVITNTTITGRRPQPVCLPLPSGISRFCGRIYNIGRKGEDFFACLGLELRSLQDIEASLRVSCFRFGPQGLRLEPAQPLPVIQNEEDEDDDDDDDDDDEYDFDDDDDDEDEEGDDKDNDLDSIDYGTFALDDDFVGNLFVESSGNRRKPVRKVTTTTSAPVYTKRRTSTRKPIASSTQKVVRRKPSKVTLATPKPIVSNVNEKVKVTTASPPKIVTAKITTAPEKPLASKKPAAPTRKKPTTTATEKVTFVTEKVTPATEKATSATEKASSATEKATAAPEKAVVTVAEKVIPPAAVTIVHVMEPITTESNKVFESVPLISHESIASVSTMLQDIQQESLPESPMESIASISNKLQSIPKKPMQQEPVKSDMPMSNVMDDIPTTHVPFHDVSNKPEDMEPVTYKEQYVHTESMTDLSPNMVEMPQDMHEEPPTEMSQNMHKEPTTQMMEDMPKESMTSISPEMDKEPVIHINNKPVAPASQNMQKEPITHVPIELVTHKVVTIGEFIAADNAINPFKIYTLPQLSTEENSIANDITTEAMITDAETNSNNEAEPQDSNKELMTTAEMIEATTTMAEDNKIMDDSEDSIENENRKDSSIIKDKHKKKRDDDDDDDYLDDDDDEDDKNEDDDDDDDPISPISSVVSDVLGDDDDDDDKNQVPKINKNVKENKKTNKKKQKKTKTESGDFLDDIMDGVMDSIKIDNDNSRTLHFR